jgi:hypothetical protein
MEPHSHTITGTDLELVLSVLLSTHTSYKVYTLGCVYDQVPSIEIDTFKELLLYFYQIIHSSHYEIGFYENYEITFFMKIPVCSQRLVRSKSSPSQDIFVKLCSQKREMVPFM